MSIIKLPKPLTGALYFFSFFLLPFYSMGQAYQWAKSIGGTDNETGSQVVIDNNGNSYLTGRFRDTVDFDPSSGTANLTAIASEDIFFAKYDSAGNYVWAKSIGSILPDVGKSIAVDNNGNVFIAGTFMLTADFDPDTIGTANLTPVGLIDIFFGKYDANGNYIWAKSIGSINN